MKPSYYPSNPSAPWRVMVPMKWSPSGKRKAEYLKTREEGQKFCQLVRKHGDHYPDYLEGGRPQGAAPVQARYDEDLWKKVARDLATQFGSIDELYKAMDHHRATNIGIKPATVEEAIRFFCEARQHDPRVTSATTHAKYRNELKKLARQFPGDRLAAIDKAKIQELRRTVKGSRTTYSTVKAFFTWATDNGYLKESPMKDEKPWSDWGVNNDYYTVEKFEQILRLCAGLDPVPGVGLTNQYQDLLPWLILGGFGGLRTREISRRDKTEDALKWSDLHFDAKIPQIEIRDAATKTKRHLLSKVYAIQAIQAWLPYVASGSEYICRIGQHDLNTLKAQFEKATGLEFKENGLRNSFSTYAICYDGKEGAGSIALQMGTSENMVMKHYVGEAFAEGEGQAWFSLRPETVFTSITQPQEKAA